LKEEISYGTFVISPTTRDVFARVVTDETEDNENTFESPALGSRTVSQMYPGERAVDAPIEFEVGFEGVLPWLLKHVCGGYDFNANSPVASANTHLFNPKQDLPLGFSMEIGVGGVPDDQAVFRYPGTKISSLELSLEQGKIMTCKVAMMPRDEDINGTSGYPQLQAPTFAALKPIKFWYFAGLTVAGSVVSKVRSFKFKIENDLERRFNLALLTDEPYPGSKRKVTLEAVIEFNNLTHYNKYKNATDGTFALTISSGTDQIVTGAQSYTLGFAGTNSRITAGRPKQTDAGILTMPLNCQLYHPSAAEFQITLVNGQTTCGTEIL
jgi:hypothetical protein